MAPAPDGFEVFKSAHDLHEYEAQVSRDDNKRFDAFLESVKDDPDVKAWLAALDESAA